MTVLLVVLVLSSGALFQARAYTDPGSGLLLWQSLVGAFFGGMFYFRKYLRRWFGWNADHPRREKDRD
jgi:hypothetical protein